MATDFSQEAVLGFLRTGGGVVRNAHLLAHFKDFLRDNEDRAHNRELFKTFVNALATVKQEDGVCYVVLKKKFRPHVGDVPVSKASSGGRRSDACTLKPAPFITDSTRSSGSGQSSDQSGALKALAETTQHNGVYRDGDSPRLRRLRRISSFLSDRPASTLSSCAPSTLDGLSSTDSTRSLAHDSACLGPRHSQVPLEPHEHDWFAKAAAGAWADVYSLFREEPGLLAKRDFLSGFNVLHWIAKHGDHRVLNTLWYGVSKTGQQLDVDARSTCGYTPLHLAALHGHRKMLRLLVHKYRADVTLRDNSGKKPWQYLEKNGDRELLELLGAPQRALGSSTGVRRSAEKPPDLAVAPSVATVKRHSSFAALFKHKPQLRVSATAESIL
uniref:SOWAHA-C winged helix-turn-helix domain-containing protein n=1 Tax=Electrophorus electricus TaxID=8005 RepID=A0AAY5EQ45_ELEEL